MPRISGGSSSPLTTKGDIYTFDTAPQRLPAGADNQIIIYDSSQPTGLRVGNITPVILGATAGKDRNRPSPNAGSLYFTTDTNQQYFSDGTHWYVGGKGSDRTTFDSSGGGFTGSVYFQSLPGAAAGPTMVAPYTINVGFYVVTLPGVGGGTIAGHGRGVVTTGWFLANSTVNSNKLRLFLTGITTPTVELNLTLTLGFHVVSISYGGGNVSYCMDGGTVTTVAAPGTYTAPDATSACFLGTFFGSTVAAMTWGRFGFIQGYASAVSSGDLQTLSNNGANFIPGVISTDPAFDWQTRWIPDGGTSNGVFGFQAYGTASSKLSTLSAQGAGLYKTNQ